MQMIKYEGNIFSKIFKKLKNIFVKTKEDVVEETSEKTEEKEMPKNDIKEVVGCKTYKPEIEIAVLAKRLEKKEITKEELTDEQKEKVIEYYREKNKELAREIEYKTKKFNELKREIINYYLKLKAN